MIILLKLLAVYIFLSFFMVGLYYSKVNITIKDIDLKRINQKTEAKYNIEVSLLLYGKLKIFKIHFHENGYYILWRYVSYKKLKDSNLFHKIKAFDLEEFLHTIKLKELKPISPKIERLNLKLDLGFENVLYTSFSIFAISTILSFLVKNSIKKYKPKKYQYVISPHYRNINQFHIQAKNSIISIKMMHIITILYHFNKRRVKNNERTSYRGAYENSYE